MDKSVGCISGNRKAGSKIDKLKILIDIPKRPSPKVTSMKYIRTNDIDLYEQRWKMCPDKLSK